MDGRVKVALLVVGRASVSGADRVLRMFEIDGDADRRVFKQVDALDDPLSRNSRSDHFSDFKFDL